MQKRTWGGVLRNEKDGQGCGERGSFGVECLGGEGDEAGTLELRIGSVRWERTFLRKGL